MSSGVNVETTWPSAADTEAADVEDARTTLSAKDLQSHIEGSVLIIDDGEEVVEVSAEIGPHSEARKRLRQLAANLLALAEGLK